MELKKILTGVFAAGLCAVNLASIPASAYGRSASVVYANRWAEGRNPEFFNFGKDNDCTNFVSQCVSRGHSMVGSGTGVPEWYKDNYIENNSYKWYSTNKINRSLPSRDYWRFTRTWSLVSDFRTFFSRSANGTCQSVDRNSTAWYSTLEWGDVVQAGNSGNGHSVIVVSASSTNPLYCGHSDNKYYVSMEKMREYAKAGGRQMYVIKPR